MRKYVVLSLVAISLLSLYGCSPKKSGGTTIKPFKEEVAIKTSDNIDVDIYLDASPSMKGYVHSKSNTVYINAVKAIESTIKSNWKKDTIQFLTFGNEIKAITRDYFLQVDQDGFYNEGDTSLEKVVHSIKSEKLNIFVSDMFQTNQDIQSLVYAIKDKCLSDDKKACAVIGLKSQFEGVVYDIGRERNSASVSGERPFYVVAMGNEDDVRAFLKNYLKNVKGAKSVMFSKNLGTDCEIALNKNNTKEKLPVMSKISSNSDKLLKFKLKLGEKVSKVAFSFQADNVIATVPDEYELKIEDLKVMPGKGFLDKVKDKIDSKKAAKDFQAAKFEKKFLSGTECKLQDNNTIKTAFLDVKLAVDGIHKQKGNYILTMGLIPEEDAYLKSLNIFNEWNFDDDKVPSEKEIGNKTQNISKLVKLIGETTYKAQNPGFHDIIFCFEAN